MKKFLVVDDSGVVRKVARRIIETIGGFEVHEAEDGKIALDFCLNEMPDAVLLDWNMPVMTGIEFLIELRKAPGGDAPKVLFCTTENDISFIQKAIMSGANEYIMKPFDAQILQDKMTQVGLL